VTDLDVAQVRTGKRHVLRAAPGELELREAAEGPQVVGRIVPFGVTQDVVDVIDGALVEYRERFLPGCTTHVRQQAARQGGPRWVKFKLGHTNTFDELIGYGQSIEERDDGVWATLGLYVDPGRLDKVRDMLRTSHTGLSVEFTDRVDPEVDLAAGPLVSRRAVNLHGVAATPLPQYADARIASVRSADGDADLGTPNLDRVAALLAELDGAPSGAR
jgi:HK97 family phage prohead protease